MSNYAGILLMDNYTKLPLKMLYSSDSKKFEWKYAGFWTRFFAIWLDDFIIGMIALFMGLTIGLTKIKIDNTYLNIFGFLISPIYNIIGLFLFGTTFGKNVFRINVISDNSDKPSLFSLVIRETIGKSISSLVFGIGYTAMINDFKKRTWHDKMAKTLVVTNLSKTYKKGIIVYLGGFIMIFIITVLTSILFFYFK